jgi:hypothetical protein
MHFRKQGSDLAKKQTNARLDLANSLGPVKHHYRSLEIDSPTALADTEVQSVLEKVAIAFIFADKDLKRFENVIRSNNAVFPNIIFYSDIVTSHDPPIQPCCGGSALGSNIVNAQYKMEQTYLDFYTRFPNMLFYVYSDHDVWWNPALLASFLSPHFTQARTAHLVTGGGLYPGWTPNLICGCGIILSHAAMEYLSVKAHVDQAREQLISGRIYVVGVKPGASYNNDHLVFAILGQLKKKLQYLPAPPYLFNVWGSTVNQIAQAVQFQMHGHDGCQPTSLRASSW